ncbi:MAG: aminotransferase class III-fold pyridoxal phosphate-dependent enzyme [Bacteroidetes bacterium]|nr:aminotransferase class III-fold pyridoxal phosphate-dependent enzyme [Bacteroidota bacterium]MBL7102990.1 aminotransferase class III-fold pyridoxal phosphate-dependent enzyme [Bacteroidales bacterium]
MKNGIPDKNEILQNNLKYTLFSWTKQSGLNPINVERAKGVYIYDRDGKRYIDFSSQLMNVNIGHGHPAIREAVLKQMEEVSYVYPGMITKVRGELGKKLAEISPGSLNKTFFTLGGADAVENAIKLARVYTGRHKIIAQYRSYHGATYAAMSAGGDPRKFPIDSQGMPNIIHIENPYVYRCPWGSKTPEECAEKSARQIERIIQFENPESIAAIIMEGESGSSGCIKFPEGYWQKIKAIADKYGILTIDDEVMSGFGRTGKWFAIEHHGVEPDIICMAKGLTSGYIPLGGIIVKEEIARHFDNNVLPLGLTYSSHPVSCTAALATIKVYEDENLLENATVMGRYLDERMEGLINKHPSIGDYRNTGLFGVIELVKNRETKEPITPWNAKPDKMEITNNIAGKIRELGMFTFVRWNWIFMAPPLCITKEQIDEGLEIISKAIGIADEYVI